MVDGELRGAVGVGGPGRRVLADRHRVRLAVGGRGRGEDDPPAVGRAHRLQQRQRAADVGRPVVLGLLLGDADEGLGREVQHRLGADVGQHRRRVVQRHLRQRRARGDGVGVPGGEVVEHGHLVAVGQQGSRHYAADVAGSTGDEDAHARHPRAAEEVEARGRAPRPAVQALPAYKPGRNPADLAREIGVDRAVKLASNEVAFPPLPAVVQALAAAAGETNRYPDNGAVVLTAALAERYGVDPAQIATGCGAVTLCQELAQAYTEPGTSIAFAWRSFEMYPLLAQVAGARAIQVPLVPGRDGGPADTHDLDGAARRDRRHHAPGLRLQPEQPHRDGGPAGGAGAVPRRRAGEDAGRARRGLPRVRHRPRRPRRHRAHARPAERRRPAHLLEGVGPGRAAGRLPDRRGPRRRRGGRARRTSRSASRCSPRPRRSPRWPARTRCGRRCAAVVAERDRLTAALRERGARRRRQPGQLRLAAAGGADRRRWPPPSRRGRSSPGRSPARASGSPSARPRRTTSSSPRSTTCAPRRRS